MFAPAADKLLYHLDSIMTPCHTEIVMFSKSYITALTPNILNNLDVIFFFTPLPQCINFVSTFPILAPCVVSTISSGRK